MTSHTTTTTRTKRPSGAGWPVAVTVVVLSVIPLSAGALRLVQITRFRRRHPTWHRSSGRFLIAAGLAVVGSALWLTLGYPAQPGTGPVLFAPRVVVSVAMGAFLVLGFAAIRRRDITAHRAWMVRAYALALGAGTQAFTEGFTEAVVGVGELSGGLAKLAGWVINLAVAEWAIRRTTHGGGGRFGVDLRGAR